MRTLIATIVLAACTPAKSKPDGNSPDCPTTRPAEASTCGGLLYCTYGIYQCACDEYAGRSGFTWGCGVPQGCPRDVNCAD